MNFARRFWRGLMERRAGRGKPPSEYQLFDALGRELKLTDLQDKGAWCQHGVGKEVAFVQRHGSALGVIINPAKRNDPYAPDLCEAHPPHRLADLKTQNTPFFQTPGGLNPQTTVAFNEKDFARYFKNYPGLLIFFWIDWIAVRYVRGPVELEVQPLTGVWRIEYSELFKVWQDAPVNEYQQRRGAAGTGQARASRYFDVARPPFVQVA